MSFWEKSTDEQKLAQIDGGIECNLTIRQIAMNCGATSPAVAYFGRKHGRSFPAKYSSHAACKRAISVRTIITSRAARVPNLLMKDAFSIFGTDGDGEEVIFDVR
jgi:hypothetical protein